MMKAEEVLTGNLLELCRRVPLAGNVRDELLVVTHIDWTSSGNIQFAGYAITDGYPMSMTPVPPSRQLDVWTKEGLR